MASRLRSQEAAASPEAPGTLGGAEAPLRLSVGALVVYGSHGIGTISQMGGAGSRGQRADVVVIDFPKGLSVTLPLERAASCLRPLSGTSELVSVRNTLRAEGAAEEESWQKRTKAARSKLFSGDAVALAEVVRNAVRQESRPTPGGGTMRLSVHERELYLEARQLLAAEVGLSRGVDEAAAHAWIDDQLSYGRADRPAGAGGRTLVSPGETTSRSTDSC